MAVLTFSNANPVRMVITEWSEGINASDRDNQYFREWSLPGFDSFFQPFLNTDILTVQFDSSYDNNIVRLCNYYTDADVYSVAATEKDDRTTYKVLEGAITITGLDGLYYVKVFGSSPGGGNYVAISEPLSISGTQCNTVKLEYYNDDTAFGIDYENSNVQFDIRVPAFFNRTADTAEREIFKDSGGNTSLISAQGTRTRVLKATKLLPQWFIEKVNLALLHDNVEIDDVAVSADQSWPYELISDRQLWAEPEANIILASGSSDYINAHDL